MKYSVIVPVYNKAEYLDDCVTSIVKQKCDDLEILLINDGSTDNSLEVCKKYESNFSNIVVIDKANSGVSNTRNLGIEKAKGEYIIFVDGDDVLASNFFEIIDSIKNPFDVLLYKSCRKYNLLSSGNEGFKSIELNDRQDEILKSVLYNQSLIKNCHFNFNRVTDYVVSSRLLKDRGILFKPKLKVGEDKVFNFKLFQNATRITYIDKFLYYIRTNGKSVMGSYNKEAFEINYRLYDAFESEISAIQNEKLKAELDQLMPCLGYQIVRNSITSNYCHKKNPLNISARQKDYLKCKSFLDNDAKKYLNDYDRFLFSVFNYPFAFMNIVMKNRLLRGALYYINKIFN